MERRDFIKQCSTICAVGAGLLLMESCGSVHYALNTAEANKIKIQKSEFLDAKKNQRQFVVIKNDNLPFPIGLYLKNGGYTALYMQCTHQGCELHANKTALVCPCHGSDFSVEGKVLNGPADKDLKQFKVITDNETIYIEL
jgi:cytochrome b6-f complex iron-sulfur subunit